MGRHTENEISVRDLAHSLEDRYLIGFYKKDPLLLTINPMRGIAKLKNGWGAIKDQLELNKRAGVKDEIRCSDRNFDRDAILYYGYTRQVISTTRDEEIQMRKMAKDLSSKTNYREVDRALYGDEVFVMTGFFRRGDKVCYEAIGYVMTQDGRKVPIRQILHKVTGNKYPKVRHLGGDGLCTPMGSTDDSMLAWMLLKQGIGVPTIEIKEGYKTKTYKLDIEGDYTFHQVDKED